jgi:cytochrome bd ubiquinol oxidase subunit I
MDVLLLSRLQFAVATLFHFLFVPLTLGLSLLIAVMETLYVKSGEEEYRRMAQFWGKIFLINFAIGVVTGITLEFQFGTNWSKYSSTVGDIFGSLLAIEATVTFFLESTFIAVWHFGWKKLSPRAHAASIWLVTVASSLSAVWILIANSWMQKPVGFHRVWNEAVGMFRFELTSFRDVITSKFALVQILHTLVGAYLLATFFVMGVSAYNILRKKETAFFVKSFRLALILGFLFSVAEVGLGDWKGQVVAANQPSKLAALEAHWETETHAPFYLFFVPDPDHERNLFEFGKIPSGLSLIIGHKPSTEVIGLKDIPREDRPPVIPVFMAFRIMVGLGFLFVLITGIGLWKRNKLESSPGFLKLMVLAIPLPYLCNETGWIVAEMGRQPWIVFGKMRTAEAVSPIAVSQVLPTLLAFIFVYGLLGSVAYYLIFRTAKKGPAPRTH